ncbi:RES domain-containing protein [Pseudobutyrivibrio sp.]|uniref:RES domain-containing protein n=1 Tax=Pseudobutyrivibrio sp. TaxID=2014367 RepID=UPI0025F1437E|nr:RES domain-containing protein [Pseudobutyrivibrio sp.]
MKIENADRESLQKLIHLKEYGPEELYEIEKHKELLNVDYLFHVIPMYFFLDKLGIEFDFGKHTVKKGEWFYRIRLFNDITDYSNLKEWEPNPFKSQNRANPEGVKALYLGSSETVCVLETQLHEGDKYVIGKYQCIEDFDVGGYLSLSKTNEWKNISAIVLNAFLIAPSRGEKNKELFEYLDDKFKDVGIEDFGSIKECINNGVEGLKLPYKFAVLNKKENLYNITNRLCEILQRNYKNGIRYSSCFIPVESPGIECSDYNLVLYEAALDKIKFCSHEVKIKEAKGKVELNPLNITKALLGDEPC